jgi:general secretion pathway protein G
MKRMNKKGFTLIELLIVITIIGILGAMLMPNLSAAQDKAKEAAVKAVMHTLQLAVESYSVDEGVYPPGTQLSVEDLYNALSEGEYLKSLPKNPFTNASYTAADPAGQILYSYDGAGQAYTLEGYGRMAGKVILRLTNS